MESRGRSDGITEQPREIVGGKNRDQRDVIWFHSTVTAIPTLVSATFTGLEWKTSKHSHHIHEKQVLEKTRFRKHSLCMDLALRL